MGLLKYSSGEYLDNLGALKGVTRKEAVPAQVTLQFTLAEHISQTAVIPKGTRVKGIDLYFETAEEGRIQPGELTADVTAVCQTAGTDGNGLKAGEIAALVDPLPYTLSVTNTGASLGGADRETDEELAELQASFPTVWGQYIEKLSEYMASTGKRYQSHAATIRRWAGEDAKKAALPTRNRDYSVKEDETV